MIIIALGAPSGRVRSGRGFAAQALGDPSLKTQLDQGLVANLPWYDHAITQPALDQFWYTVANFLQAHGCTQVPAELQRHTDVRSLWQSPRLMLSQCCGPDLFTREGMALSVIGRPSFEQLTCEPGYYYSHIVGCRDDLQSPVRVAVNSLSSRSGYLALLEWTKSNKVDISSIKVSGSHLNSLKLLSENQADIAAIDAHVINQYKLNIDLPVHGVSHAALAPPFVCHRDNGLDKELLFAALKHAIVTTGKNIGITALIETRRSDYQHMSSPPAASDVTISNPDYS